jgi:hypothetical protein
MKFLKKWNEERLIRKRKLNVERSYENMMIAYNSFMFFEDAKKALLKTLLTILSEEECEQYSNILGRHAHEKGRFRMNREQNDE